MTDINFDSEDYSLDPIADFSRALDATPRDTMQGFGVTTDSPYSKSRQLIESENEVHLGRFKDLEKKALNPNYEMSPTEAFASTVLGILPVALGYALGGNAGGAQGAQVGNHASTEVIGNFAKSEKEQRDAAAAMAKTEYEQYTSGRQRANTLESADLAAQDRRAIQEDSQAFQSGQTDKTIAAADRRAGGGGPGEARRQAVVDRQQKALDIPGLGRMPGYQPDTTDKGNAQKVLGVFNRGMVSIKGLKAAFENPSSTTDDLNAATANAIVVLKEMKNMGANFTEMESNLIKAGLPTGFLDPDPAKLRTTVLSMLRGQDGPKRIDDLLNRTRAELRGQLTPFKYYVVGEQYDPSEVAQWKIPVDSGTGKAAMPSAPIDESMATPGNVGIMYNGSPLDPNLSRVDESQRGEIVRSIAKSLQGRERAAAMRAIAQANGWTVDQIKAYLAGGQ